MRKLDSRAITPAISLLAVAFSSISCFTSKPRPTPIPIGTAGVIYRANDIDEFPSSFYDWKYDPNHLLLFYRGAWEIIAAEPVIGLYDWRTDEFHELKIPELNAYNSVTYDFSQGPDSRFIAYSADGEIYLLNVEGGSVEHVTSGEDPSISPESSRLAFWKMDEIFLIDLETLEEETIYQSDKIFKSEGYSGSGCCLSWSPDGTYLAFILRTDSIEEGKRTIGESIILVNLDTQESHVVSEDREWSLPAWSPDGRLIASVQNDMRYGSEIRILDPFNNCVVDRFRTGPISHVMWFPDGKEIGMIYFSRQIYLLDVEAAFGAPYTSLACK
ncbi:MAG: hypothetical protein GTO18_16895 [Anaerolineales bacterium]|nr:hypothetical protein [Anaerolineales bacterium]